MRAGGGAGDSVNDGAGGDLAGAGAAGWPRAEVVSADGLRLSVVIARPGADRGTGVDDAPAALPPILALHGFASSAAAGWGRTGHLDALVRAGRTVVAPDLRGHGESERPHDPGRYSLEVVLADIAAVAAALPGWVSGHRAGTPLDVIGYSLGARLSWTVACRGVLPVRRLVLGGFDGRPLFQGADPERLDRLAAGAPGNDREALRALVRGLAGTGSTVSADDEPPPAIPTLIVAGDKDPLASGAEACAAALPRGRFLSIPGRNHISTVPARAYRQTEVEFLAAEAAR